MIVCVRGVKNIPMILSNYPSFWRVSLWGNENIKKKIFSEKKFPQSEPPGGKWGYSSTYRGCNPSCLFLAIAKDPMSLHLGPSVRGRACFVLTEFVKSFLEKFSRAWSRWWSYKNLFRRMRFLHRHGRKNYLNLESVFLSEKCWKGIPVTCVVGFGSVVLPTKKVAFW